MSSESDTCTKAAPAPRRPSDCPAVDGGSGGHYRRRRGPSARRTGCGFWVPATTWADDRLRLRRFVERKIASETVGRRAAEGVRVPARMDARRRPRSSRRNGRQPKRDLGRQSHALRMHGEGGRERSGPTEPGEIRIREAGPMRHRHSSAQSGRCERPRRRTLRPPDREKGGGSALALATRRSHSARAIVPPVAKLMSASATEQRACIHEDRDSELLLRS